MRWAETESADRIAFWTLCTNQDANQSLKPEWDIDADFKVGFRQHESAERMEQCCSQVKLSLGSFYKSTCESDIETQRINERIKDSKGWI